LFTLVDRTGFTKSQIVIIQFTLGLSSMFGGWLGGLMGDYFSATGLVGSHGSESRIQLALVSVIGGIPLYGMFLYSKSFSWALLWVNLFHLVATWPPSCAIRPICAELTEGPSERAQIVALWIVLEKASGALLGAPLVGFLTNRMLESNNQEENSNEEKAQALAFNLFLLSSIFWSACAFFWVVMLVTIHRSKKPSSSDGGMIPLVSVSSKRVTSP
jgi:Na+/melibiose symporter-like transporter